MTVETGTGTTGADSYLDASAALVILEARGSGPAWDAAGDDEKAAALVKATAYIDGYYGGRYPGWRLNPAQGLMWPRAGAADRDGWPLVGVPDPVKLATALAALRALTEDLAPDAARGGQVESVTVGPITKKFAASAVPDTARPEIDNAMRPIIGSGLRIQR